MFNGIKVIDADGHVMEPNELYDEYLVYASDYPHFDGRFPHTVSLTAGRNEFEVGVARKILEENPTRL